MNVKIKALLKDVNENLVWYRVNLGDKKKNFNADLQEILISGLKGVYFIRTNTPIKVLKNVGCPVVDVNNHKNIPKIIEKNKNVINNKLNVKKDNDKKYVVYNGKGQDILDRIIAHLGSPKGNGCLALEQYDELKSFQWEIAFYIEDDEIKRTLIEQAWRGRFGWPVLCEE